MLNVNLLKEIETKSKEKENSDTEIVKQVQLLLDSKGQEEKAVLEKCGLDHHIKVAENITGESIERKTFFDRYGKALTKDQVTELCFKYGLRCLKTSYYKGNIGPNVSSDIKRFVDAQGLEGELNCGNFKRSLYIMAPKGAFVLEKKPVDPVLFYNPNEYNGKESLFVPISKWGSDFTFLRRLAGLFSWYVFRITFIVSITATILVLLIGSFIPAFFLYGLMIVVFLFAIINDIPSAEDLKEMWSERSYNPFSSFKD